MTDELKPVYQGPSNRPEPVFAEDDPWGHRARQQALASPDRPQPKTLEEYELQVQQWRAENGPPEDFKGFYRLQGFEGPGVATDYERCPVCNAPKEMMPGCYVPYAGRRWDCFEMFGRNLTGDERRQIIESEARLPRHPGFNGSATDQSSSQ